jgi:hypothetical protein
MSSAKVKKTLWRDIGDLRLPNGNWRLGRAAKCIAHLLGLPASAVIFMRPKSQRAFSSKKLGSLRAEWQTYKGRS